MKRALFEPASAGSAKTASGSTFRTSTCSRRVRNGADTPRHSREGRPAALASSPAAPRAAAASPVHIVETPNPNPARVRRATRCRLFGSQKIRERVAHVRNGMFSADRQKRDWQPAFEPLFIELHVFDDVAAIIESRIHPAFSGVSFCIGGYVARRNCARRVHLVFKPPPDVDVLSSFRQLGRQIGKHLKNEVPLSLVVRQLEVIG